MFQIENIISSFRSHIKMREIAILLGIVFLFLFTRIFHISQMPIFTDEGIYIHWAKVAWHDASWRFISLTDGRQPLQTWMTIPFLKLFPNNLLLAGRLFGVASGLIAASGMFSLLWYIYGKRAALLGTFIYILTPYFLFYDRMALVDSMVNAACIWLLFLSIVLVRTRRLDVAFLFGLIGGLFLLAKSSVRAFFLVTVFAPILLWKKNRINVFILESVNFFILFAFGCVIAFIIYNVQRLSPYLHFVTQKESTFLIPFGEFIKNPFVAIFSNIRVMPIYVLQESGWLLGITALAGYLLMFKHNKRLALYTLIWFIIPYAAIAFLSRVLFPRYMMFFASYFIIFTTQLFSGHIQKKFVIPITILLLLSFAYPNYTILANYTQLPFPEIDRGQYVQGGASGYGAKEIVDYARQVSEDKPVILIAEGNFGMSGDVLDVFIRPADRISIDPVWPINKEAIEKRQADTIDHHVYAVTAYYDVMPPEWPTKVIKKYTKPGGKSAMMLLEVLPPTR